MDETTHRMLERIASYVAIETPSGNEEHAHALADLITRDLIDAGASVESFPAPGHGANLVARWPGDGRKPIAMLAHYDTVHPVGTIARLPFRIDGPRAYGPGIYDMKAGIALIVEVMRSASRSRPVTALITCDEEIGSHTSRELIETTARESHACFVLEPPLPDGGMKTARKGVGVFLLETHGRQAHAGVEPGTGIDAIAEMARLIVDVHALAKHEAGTTLNVGRVAGGTASNVIAEHAVAEIDVRFTVPEEGARVEAALRALRPHDARVGVSLSGRLNRPPFVRTPQVAELYEFARGHAAAVGLELGEGATGGASDGNFTAAAGAPTLDGLGIPGAGAHTLEEHILVDALSSRVAFLRRLIEQI